MPAPDPNRPGVRPARSLADQLRTWPDARLAQLLRERPDLAVPLPQDSSQVASRAVSRASLSRALDGLTTVELHVLEALALLGTAPPDEVDRIVHAEPEVVARALSRLADLALVWEGPTGLRAVGGIVDGLLAGRGGVAGVRARSPQPPSPAVVAARLAEVGTEARALLDHLLRHGGEGVTGTARASVTPEEASGPVEELLARRLLVPRAVGVVQLPGEVALALRGGRTTLEPVGTAPVLATTPRDPAQVDRVAAGAAFETVRRVGLLLDHWGSHPPLALRAGGLGVRELRVASTLLLVDPPTTALVIETAAARLLALGADLAGNTAWLPTDAFDAWSARTAAERWIVLVEAWLGTPRTPSLVGTQVAPGRPGAKVWAALAPDLGSPLQVETRRQALAALAELQAGVALATGTGLPSLVALLTWRRPRRPRLRNDLAAWTVAEAAALGLAGLGALASPARALLAGDPDSARASLDRLLPPAVDQILLQADLTAVAPGPLTPDLAGRLHAVADIESRGGATVYRFTRDSVRRALDAGWSAQELHELLAAASRTPVPQPLTYLVDDTARTFGTLRIGHAESFVRADDEAALTELLAGPAARGLLLRRVAPTVLVSELPVDELMAGLREAGSAPVLEGADGSVRVPRRTLLRARTPREAPGTALDGTRLAAQVAHAVTAVRAGDRAAAARPRAGAVATTPGGAMAALREAIQAADPVWIGYLDDQGTASERLVDPVAVADGRLTAYDRLSADTRTFAVHRITRVRAVDDPGRRAGS